MLGRKHHKSGEIFGDMVSVPEPARKSAVSMIEISSSLSVSYDSTDVMAGMHRSSSEGMLVGKRSIMVGRPKTKRRQTKSPPSAGRRSGKCSTVSLVAVSVSDSDDVEPRVQEAAQRKTRRHRQLESSKSRTRGRMWSGSPPPQLIQGQAVTRSCSRHRAQLSPAPRVMSRSPPIRGAFPPVGRTHSISPNRARSPMRVASPRKQTFEVVEDMAYYAEPVVSDRMRLLRREDQRFQMTADEPGPQAKSKYHEPRLRVTYAHRVSSVVGASRSESTLAESNSSLTTQSSAKSNDVAHFRVNRTGQPLCRASSAEFRNTSQPSRFRNSPPVLCRTPPPILRQPSFRPPSQSSSSSETWHTAANTRHRPSPQSFCQPSWTPAYQLAPCPRRRSSPLSQRPPSPRRIRRSSSLSFEWPPSPAQLRLSPIPQHRSIPQPFWQSSSTSSDWPPSPPRFGTSPLERRYSPQPLCRISSTSVNRQRPTCPFQSSSISFGWPSDRPVRRRSSPPVCDSSSTLEQWLPSTEAHRAFTKQRAWSTTSFLTLAQVVPRSSPVEHRSSSTAMTRSSSGGLGSASSNGSQRSLSPPPPKPPVPPPMPPPKGLSMLPVKRRDVSSISSYRRAMSPPPVPPIPPTMLPPTSDDTSSDPESSISIIDMQEIEDSIKLDIMRRQREHDEKDQLRIYEQQHQQILLKLQQQLEQQQPERPQTNLYRSPGLQTVSKLQSALQAQFQRPPLIMPLDNAQSLFQAQFQSPQQSLSQPLLIDEPPPAFLSSGNQQAILQPEIKGQEEPPPVLQVQFHSPSPLMPQMMGEMPMQMQLPVGEPLLVPVSPMQYPPTMQAMQQPGHFQEQRFLRPQKSHPHTVVTLQRSERNLKTQKQRDRSPEHPVQPSYGQPRTQSPYWSHFGDIGNQPPRIQPRMPLRVPLGVPQRISPKDIASMAASLQPFDFNSMSQQRNLQGLFKSQEYEPCMQQYPMPVMGYDPTAPMIRPRPLPLRLNRPRLSAPAQQRAGRQDMKCQVKLQQHILEQRQQMQENLRAARSQGPAKSSASSLQIQIRHKSAPHVSQLQQQGGIARQGIGQQQFGRQQMMRQHRQMEEEFYRQRMLQAKTQSGQMKGLLEKDNNVTDTGNQKRRIIVTATSTKTSLEDTDSTTNYRGTEYGGSEYDGTQYGGTGYDSGGTEYGISRSKRSTVSGAQGMLSPPESENQKPIVPAPRKQNYRHAAIETRMRNSQTEMVVYFVVLLATIIGLWTVLDIYGRRVSMNSNGTLYMMPTNSVVKEIISGDARVGVLINVSEPPSFEICSSLACQVEGNYVSHELNWNVNPCESMYKFVCSKRAQKSQQSIGSASLSDLESSLLRLLEQHEPPSPAGRLLNRLWTECLDPKARNQHGWGPLKHMLKAASLGDWPYLRFSTGGEPDIWESAALLLRYFGLATLVQLEPSRPPKTGSPLLALDKPIPLLRPTNDSSWYYDAASLAASAAARKNVAPHSVALEVTNFARQLTVVVHSPPAARDIDHDYKVKKLHNIPRYRALLVAFHQNESQVNDDTEVLLRAPEYVIRLEYLLDDTPPHVVLNYMGFRMLVHISPFLPEPLNKLTQVRARQLGLGPRTTTKVICLRVVAEALPTIFYRVAYEVHHELLDALLTADLGSSLKQAFASRLNMLSWLDADTRERALQRLHQLQLQLLFPSYLADSMKAARDANQVPEIIPGEGLRSYARITKQLMQRRLNGAEPWIIPSPTEQRCWQDSSRHTLYVPLTALNTSTPAGEPFVLLQLARLGERVARCMVQIMLEGASQNAGVSRSWWTAEARKGLGVVRKCYVLQNDGKHTEVGIAEDNAALVVAHTAFESRMPAIDFRLENAASMSLDQLFYINYVLGQCSTDPQTPRRVNLALVNCGGFQRAFTCSPGTPMNPRKSCNFW